MVKHRDDLSVAAFRIVEAIRTNDWSLDPPYERVDFLPILGYEVLELRKPFEIRLPWKKVALSKRGRSNRLWIQAGYLCLRWVKLSQDSPLWYLTQEPKDVRQVKGIFYDHDDKQWKLLIYQVVDDMSHARRMFIHIFANYQRELSTKEALQRSIEQSTVGSAVFGVALSPKARLETQAFQLWLDRRVANVGRISATLNSRYDHVHFYAERVTAILHGIAGTLKADADNLLKSDEINLANLQTNLRNERDKLDRFVSSNIISLRRHAQSRIDRAFTLSGTDRKASAAYLRDAALKLETAGEEMQRWSVSISESEMNDAAAFRGVATS